MCGLVQGKRKGNFPIANAVLKRYENQKSRGTEGFGYIAVKDGYIKSVERAETEDEIRKKLEKETSNEILFHHRRPTSTPNYEELAHPMVIKDDCFKHDYYIIHNGIIRNASELKEEHEKLGIKYQTELLEIKKTVAKTKTKERVSETVYTHKFNDSEALAVELALYFEGKKDAIDAMGAVAFIGYETDKKGKVLKMHYGRNTNPLMIEENGDLFFLRSEDGNDDIEKDTITTVDYITGHTVTNNIEIGNYTYQVPRQREPQLPNFDGTPDYLPSGKEHERETDYDYYYSKHHLEDVKEEITCLEQDIEDCVTWLDKYPEGRSIPNQELDSFLFYTEYKEECEDKLKEKQEYANSIMEYLDYTKTNKSIGFS